ncbi:MAG TPA: hypothetical protein VGF98_06905 [Candidatus Tumulicola sp.]
MSDYRRRRRSDEGRESGGLPLIPLVLVVVFAGLLLGALLAHFFGGGPGKQSSGTTVAQSTPLLVTPVPTEQPVLNPRSSPSPAVSPTHTASSTPSPTASPSTSPSTSPQPSKSPKASPTQTTRVALSPHPVSSAIVHQIAEAPPQPDRGVPSRPAVEPTATPAATPAPAAPDGSERAAGVVRSYLSALASGNRALATTYLSSGTPGEVFMDSTAHVVSLKSTASGTGYHVAAEVQTAAGAYAVTFSVEPGTSGLQITDHYAIKEH